MTDKHNSKALRLLSKNRLLRKQLAAARAGAVREEGRRAGIRKAIALLRKFSSEVEAARIDPGGFWVADEALTRVEALLEKDTALAELEKNDD